MPVFGGVVLDLTALAGIVAVDETSGVVEVLAGTFGPDLERELQAEHGLSVGHFPQSFDIATVGGWVACRGAGQYSHPLRQDRGHRRRARGRARRRHASCAPAARRPPPSVPI